MKTLLLKTDSLDSKHKLYSTLKELRPGEYIVEIKKKKHIRSIDQNSYYWAILTIIANETGEFDRDRLHEICKKKFNGEMVTLPKSGMEQVGKSTSELDSGEMTSYITRVKMWARDEFGVIIRDRAEMDYVHWSEIQNEYERTFSGF